MKKIITLLVLICLYSSEGKARSDEKTGLLIIDAQKWFIPGHPESMYELWGIKGHTRGADELIGSMSSVLTWANQKKIPAFVTYEGSDSGRYDLPSALKNNLDRSTTRHFVKVYYAATKHKEFNAMIDSSGIRNWIVIGAETDVCVYQTVKELLKKNMNVALVKEAIYSGRNNTEVALNNMVAFGADTIHISDLTRGKSIFTNRLKKIERDLSYDDVVVTVFPVDSSSVDPKDKASLIRLEYLKKYAQVVGIRVEVMHKDSVIKSLNKIRLVAGSLNSEKYKTLQSRTKDSLIVVSDCITGVPYQKQPKAWHKKTVKMIYYELMQSAAFYSKSIEQLEGWQKELKKAMKEGRLDYVESSQNL